MIITTLSEKGYKSCHLGSTYSFVSFRY